MINEDIKKARNLFYKKDYENAFKLFISQNALYEAGLCSLLLKDIKSSKKYWGKIKNIDPAANFGLCILECINFKSEKLPKVSPSFFQTRAQLEIYLNLFLQNKLIDWAQNILSCREIFFKANPESYKFIARALFANGYFSIAVMFCKKSLDIFYLDPEAMLILSQCYFLLGDNAQALDIVNKIKAYVCDYYPAHLFEKLIREKIDKKSYF